MSDLWKQRLKKVAPWIMFVGTAVAWITSGFQGPPPTPPLLIEVQQQNTQILQRIEEIGQVIASPRAALKSPRLDTVAEVRAALIADLDRLLGQRSWIVDEEQKRLLRAVRAVVESDDAVIEAILAKLQ